MKSILDEIKFLEEGLLHDNMRDNPNKLDELLALEFEEISPAGQITGREAVVEWLLNKDVNARWALSEFKVKQLSDELLLATYKAKQIAPLVVTSVSVSLGSLRSSLWRKNIDDDTWQMVFHQATKIL